MTNRIVSNMVSYQIIGCLLSVVSLGTLVIGDPLSVVQLTKVKVINNANDYLGNWDVKINNDGKKSTKVDIKMPTKKDFPPTMQMKFFIDMAASGPVEYATTVCDGLDDPVIGKSLANAGIPKGQFPTVCPFVAGNDYEIKNWNPPTDMIPPGVPDGPFTGYMEVGEDGKTSYVKFEFEGTISHALPGIGR